jgi:hypothetical protein
MSPLDFLKEGNRINGLVGGIGSAAVRKRGRKVKTNRVRMGGRRGRGTKD